MEKLRNKIETFRTALPDIAQRSPEWARMREPRIGASELSALLGVNPFCDRYHLMRKKINPDPPVLNTFLKWGELLETSIKSYLITTIGIPFYEFGLIVHNDVLCCSPDGVAIVNPRKFAQTMVKEGYRDSYTDAEIASLPDADIITLMEFKSLMTRIPIMGAIPEYYEPQVQGGIAMSKNLCEIGLYIESKYDVDVVSSDFKIPIDHKPVLLNYHFVTPQQDFLNMIEPLAHDTMHACHTIMHQTNDPLTRISLLDKWYTSELRYDEKDMSAYL